MLSIILRNHLTASIGYFPIAVSPESKSPSTPHLTAVITSTTSDLVGRGFSIIESSSWVATITGTPDFRHVLTISSCMLGISSREKYMPRSPLATRIPSLVLIMLSKLSTADFVSILEITLILALNLLSISLNSTTCSLLLMKESIR